jgi:hypothetical protein
MICDKYRGKNTGPQCVNKHTVVLDGAFYLTYNVTNTTGWTLYLLIQTL